MIKSVLPILVLTCLQGIVTCTQEPSGFFMAGGYSDTAAWVKSNTTGFFNPSTGVYCDIPSVPWGNRAERFTSQGLTVCGGNLADWTQETGYNWTSTHSCVSFNTTTGKTCY